MTQEKIKNLFTSLGVTKFGFGNLEEVIPEKYADLSTGISFAIRLSDAVMDEISDDAPTHTYFHHYRTVNAFIDHVALRVVMLLQSEGYKAIAIPASQSINEPGYDYSGLFQHRTVATRAGMGWIGKNACLITPEYGPRVRLGSIITNFKGIYDEPVNTSKCGDCELCVVKCPPIALKGNLWSKDVHRNDLVDARICSQHMSTHYKHIGRGVVCGICVKSCPIGKERL
ncbi:MAG: epoxyqueuosine reductase [Clostridia bacterium]|nr:epoxyqueuosine reductase [Clostridia bacterium]